MIRTLGRLGRAEAGTALVGVLERRVRLGGGWLRELKSAAVAALGGIPGDEAVAALAQAAQTRDTQLRRAAQTALDRRAHARTARGKLSRSCPCSGSTSARSASASRSPTRASGSPCPAGILESRGRASRPRGDPQPGGGARRAARVVVGLPLHMNGRAGPEAEAARAFAAALAGELGLPVETLDERWSTVEAERTLRETGQSGRKRRAGDADTLAATLLLRTFLERRARAEGRAP